jgi:hypothetical protein
MAMAYTTSFTFGDPSHRTLAAWRDGDLTYRGPRCPRYSPYWAAKWYAHQHGEAKVLRAEDSVVRYWIDEGTLRQRTYRKVIFTK